MMHINVGDLVQCNRLKVLKLGLVVDKKPPNDGLISSMHVRHMLNSYRNIYYVYFSGEGKQGPFYENELKLQQSFQIAESIEE
jgi:hypothetical protein